MQYRDEARIHTTEVRRGGGSGGRQSGGRVAIGGAVGDDHIQEQGSGRVVPESWTHGSSDMRQRWVTKGFDTGDPNVCDTFATEDL